MICFLYLQVKVFILIPGVLNNGSQCKILLFKYFTDIAGVYINFYNIYGELRILVQQAGNKY